MGIVASLAAPSRSWSAWWSGALAWLRGRFYRRLTQRGSTDNRMNSKTYAHAVAGGGGVGIEQNVVEADPALRRGGMLDAWTRKTRSSPLCIDC